MGFDVPVVFISDCTKRVGEMDVSFTLLAISTKDGLNLSYSEGRIISAVIVFLIFAALWYIAKD